MFEESKSHARQLALPSGERLNQLASLLAHTLSQNKKRKKGEI
jgi:hypothetical protein